MDCCHGVHIRMADSSDLPAVEAAFRSSLPRLRACFGFLDFANLIDVSLYPLVGLSRDGEIIAFASFSDVPSVPGGIFGRKAAEAKAWAMKEATNFGFHDENTFWMEVCATSSVEAYAENEFLKAFLHALFKLSPGTKAVLSLSPFEHVALRGSLKPLCRSEEMDLLLSACVQSTVLPTFNIRKAVVENYDYLIPIIEKAHKQGAALAQVPDSAAPEYPYSLARLIAAQDENDKVLVAEFENKLVGMAALTSKMDTNFLRQFDLETYDGLIISPDHAQTLLNNTEFNGAENDKREPGSSVVNDVLAPEGIVERFQVSGKATAKKFINAFQITMFCLEDEHTNGAADLLSSAFMHYGMDYCLLPLPFNKPAPAFLHYFTSISMKGSSQKEMATQSSLELYLLHRQSLYPNLAGMTFVAALPSQVVGFALVEATSPTEALISHFDLQSFLRLNQQQKANHATIILFVLNPIFANCRKFFLREIMRQMGKTVLFCPVFSSQDLPDVIQDMILVPGRQHTFMSAPCTWGQISEPTQSPVRSSFRASVYSSTQQTTSDAEKTVKWGQYVGFNCALFAMTHNLTSRYRITVNSRMVFIGASQTAAACLHKIITNVKLKFSNLTIVSPLGFKGLSVRSKMFLDAMDGFSSFETLGIDCLVSVVAGTVVDFDRKAKCIHLSDGSSLDYDYLIFSIGLQDQMRWELQGSLSKGIVRLDELAVLLDESTSLFKTPEVTTPFVIYGLSLDTFYSIQLLLSKGIPGSQLLVIYPEVESLENFAIKCFKESAITELVMKEVKETGLIIKAGFKILELKLGEESNALKSVILADARKISQDVQDFQGPADDSSSHGETVEHFEQPCMLLITCNERRVDCTLLRAIKKEGLVFNGRIVVDGTFQTNDPCIFSCGSAAKFSRRCGKLPSMETLNSCELGRNLATAIISLFNDHLPHQRTLWAGLLPAPSELLPHSRQQEKWPRTYIPRLVQPKFIGGVLPGWLFYFSIKCAVITFYTTEKDTIQPLIARKDGCILKIDFSKNQKIQSIKYCGKANLEPWRLLRIVGFHEPMINHVRRRGINANINIIDLLSRPWFALVFHDKFSDFYHNLSLQVHELKEQYPQEKGLVEDVIKDNLITFLKVYKEDFSGLNETCPNFCKNIDQIAVPSPRTRKSVSTLSSTALPIKHDSKQKDKPSFKEESSQDSASNDAKATSDSIKAQINSQEINTVIEALSLAVVNKHEINLLMEALTSAVENRVEISSVIHAITSAVESHDEIRATMTVLMSKLGNKESVEFSGEVGTTSRARDQFLQRNKNINVQLRVKGDGLVSVEFQLEGEEGGSMPRQLQQQQVQVILEALSDAVEVKFSLGIQERSSGSERQVIL